MCCRRATSTAWGAVLYELLSGQPPFCGPPSYVIFHTIHHDPPPLHTIAPRVPRALAAICQKAMAKRPDHRYASCEDFAKDLRCWLRGETPWLAAAPLGSIGEMTNSTPAPTGCGSSTSRSSPPERSRNRSAHRSLLLASERSGLPSRSARCEIPLARSGGFPRSPRFPSLRYSPDRQRRACRCTSCSSGISVVDVVFAADQKWADHVTAFAGHDSLMKAQMQFHRVSARPMGHQEETLPGARGKSRVGLDRRRRRRIRSMGGHRGGPRRSGHRLQRRVDRDRG